MKNEKIYNMPFGKVYGLLINKALRKNRTQKEVIELTSWLLGYSEEEINNASSIVILTHENPDGDAIGSCLAMKVALKQLGKNADVIIREIPKIYFVYISF